GSPGTGGGRRRRGKAEGGRRRPPAAAASHTAIWELPVTARKSFGSDNHAGAHEAVLRMMARANTGDAVAYGDDLWTQRASDELRELFGARGGVFLVFTGGAANVLGLSLLLRPYEGVICPESAHVNVDECGAAERIIGCKLLTVATPDGKLTPDLIATRLGGRGDVHPGPPPAGAISPGTGLGTRYTPGELRALAGFCGSEGLRLVAGGGRPPTARPRLGRRPAR